MPAPACAGASMREPSELVSLLRRCRCFPMPSSGWVTSLQGQQCTGEHVQRVRGAGEQSHEGDQTKRVREAGEKGKGSRGAGEQGRGRETGEEQQRTVE